jgi:hypothetical protein
MRACGNEASCGSRCGCGSRAATKARPLDHRPLHRQRRGPDPGCARSGTSDVRAGRPERSRPTCPKRTEDSGCVAMPCPGRGRCEPRCARGFRTGARRRRADMGCHDRPADRRIRRPAFPLRSRRGTWARGSRARAIRGAGRQLEPLGGSATWAVARRCRKPRLRRHRRDMFKYLSRRAARRAATASRLLRGQSRALRLARVAGRRLRKSVFRREGTLAAASLYYCGSERVHPYDVHRSAGPAGTCRPRSTRPAVAR